MSSTSSQCRILVHAVPGAKTSSVAGMHGDAIRIRIQAPPVDGKANEALREFLAAKLKLRPRDIVLLKGEASREKMLEIHGLDHEAVLKLLGI